jgi:hypothetical protein
MAGYRLSVTAPSVGALAGQVGWDRATGTGPRSLG